jgi:hypothetical protein
MFGVELLASRRTRSESGKRLNDDATLVRETRASIDNEPPAHSTMFTKKMSGSNSHFTRFHIGHLTEARPYFVRSKLQFAENATVRDRN